MAFFNQPVSGECCPDPCARSGPCDPCVTTTTTSTTPAGTTTTTTTTTTSTTSTTLAPTCGVSSFTVSGASTGFNGIYSSSGTHGPNEYYTYNNKHLFMSGVSIAAATWEICNDPVGSFPIYTADNMGGSCPTDVTWTGAGITIS